MNSILRSVKLTAKKMSARGFLTSLITFEAAASGMKWIKRHLFEPYWIRITCNPKLTTELDIYRKRPISTTEVVEFAIMSRVLGSVYINDGWSNLSYGK